MKMTLLALGVKCGFLAPSGLTNLVWPSAATACLAKKASSSRPARATPVKPAPACQRNSRRVRPQKSRIRLTPQEDHHETHERHEIEDRIVFPFRVFRVFRGDNVFSNSG